MSQSETAGSLQQELAGAGTPASADALHTAVQANANASPSNTIYGIDSVRQGVIALLLLLVLPFTFGAVHMMARRAVDGLWFEMAALSIITAGLLAVTAMLLLALLYTLRARVVFGRAALSYTLPRHGGPLPLLRYARQDIPYHAIKSIELRREVFGGKLAPVLLRGLVVHTKDNREFVLGHTLEGFDDPSLPFAHIAERLASRCALQLQQPQAIWRRTRKERALGYISEYDTNAYVLDAAETERLNATHRSLIYGIASALAALVMLGLLADWSSRGL